MKLIINNNQLTLLTTHFHLIEGQCLVQNGDSIITESRMKEFLVWVIVNGWPAQLRVGAQNKSNALSIIRQLFPKARLTGAIISA